jgi:Mn-containing catalase
MTREITHMKAFTAALESLGKDRFVIGAIPPTNGLVDEYFNVSTGQGDQGEVDAEGPWNRGDSWKVREFAELQKGVEQYAGCATGKGESLPGQAGTGRLGSTRTKRIA